MIHTSTICLFAKPPLAGRAKTRLAPALGKAGAAALAAAFLDDTWALARSVRARAIVATTDPWDGWPPGAEVWLQGEGDLGERLERVLARALTEAPGALALGADAPALPRAHLETALVALETADAVIGPASDGGYWCLGLRRCPPGLLRDLPWSAPDTAARTRDRLVASGLAVTTVGEWFDVDEPADLLRLREALASDPAAAPATRRVLAQTPGA